MAPWLIPVQGRPNLVRRRVVVHAAKAQTYQGGVMVVVVERLVDSDSD